MAANMGTGHIPFFLAARHKKADATWSAMWDTQEVDWVPQV
jgi:hypothetical protein